MRSLKYHALPLTAPSATPVLFVECVRCCLASNVSDAACAAAVGVVEPVSAARSLERALREMKCHVSKDLIRYAVGPQEIQEQSRC